MAFHQPTARQAAQRPFRPALEDEELSQPQPTVTQPIEESQTWVLFSPATDPGTTTSYLTTSQKSDLTPGRSRLSDLGSLNSVVRSEVSGERQPSDSFIDAADEDEDLELDSLDSHLPEFRSTPDFFNSSSLPHAAPIVPAHDGLGSFRLEQDGMGSEVQNRIYAFERFNPRGNKRRRESLEQAQIVMESEEVREMEKMRRIETWRLEQSRYLLEEIQKETRRRRKPTISAATPRQADTSAEATAPIDDVGGGDFESWEEEWHDQNPADVTGEREGLLGRVTRKVIQNLMGIDDKMLSVLFGEALPDDEDLATTPKASTMATGEASTLPVASLNSSWQTKMLERVATELGMLVNQLSEHQHPGAFSAFSRVQQMPIPYAGLPAIPETASGRITKTATNEHVSTMPEFKPSIPSTTRPIDVPRTRRDSAHSRPHQAEITGSAFTQEEWEQDLDIRLVFRYIRSRFLSRSTGSNGFSGASHTTTSSTQDVAAKVARVRQHHPLVSRSRTMERRKSKATIASNAALLRPASSCTSQSTRRSVRRSSASSSRHYWDIGGSVGTGSMVATTGPMGSWGEV
ncbi:hypothetical protein F5Y18DRAFT_7403 [Xylariaceae sp. FL1019]|nr:hypothetical protein F5Y18DRAFT_7403 [Xylariaceae sp. FL1019]